MRQRDRVAERQRDRETERQRDRGNAKDHLLTVYNQVGGTTVHDVHRRRPHPVPGRRCAEGLQSGRRIRRLRYVRMYCVEGAVSYMI